MLRGECLRHSSVFPVDIALHPFDGLVFAAQVVDERSPPFIEISQPDRRRRVRLSGR